MSAAVAERTSLRLDAWGEYAHATGGEHYAWWARTHLVQVIGQFAGKPLELEPWQLAVTNEVLSVDTDGRPYWRIVVIENNRKNGKTTEVGGGALYEADQGEGQPEVLFAGSTDLQSGRLFDVAVRFIRGSRYLSRRFHVRQHVGEIERVDGGAKLYRVATMNAPAQEGWNPSLVLPDELHAWTRPSHREAWDALTTADGARDASQVRAITTAGQAKHRRTGILGQILDGNKLTGEVERVAGCTISRNHDSRTIVFEFHAVSARDADPRPLRKAVQDLRAAEAEHGVESAEAAELRARQDELAARLLRSVRPANPSSWVRDEYLLQKAIGPSPRPPAFLRRHAGLWADDEDAYIADETWTELGDRAHVIADGSKVCLGIDGSRTHDTTVVSWSTWDGRRIRTRCHVFSAREDAPHHTLCAGGRIDYDMVEAFIEGLFERFDVVDAAYDPRYLVRSAELLERRLPGARIVAVEPTSAPMKTAVATLERVVVDGELEHDGDQVLAAHVANTVAVRLPGYTRLAKSDDEDAIDATVATALSVWRAEHHAARAARTGGPLEVIDLGDVFGHDAEDEDDDSEAAMIRRLRDGGML